MYNFIKKYISKIIFVFVILICLLAFRESIMTDDNTKTVFNSLMGELPFAKLITDILGKISESPDIVKNITSSGVLEDLIKLAIMSIIQASFVGLITAIFLPMKGTKNSYESEDYMDQTSYKVKETIIKIITAPILAIFTSHIITYFMDIIAISTSKVASIISGIILIIILGAVSLIPLVLLSGISLKKAVLWRLVITFAAGMIKTFSINFLCFYIYWAFSGELGVHMITSIAALVIWLIIMDMGIQSLKCAIVG